MGRASRRSGNADVSCLELCRRKRPDLRSHRFFGDGALLAKQAITSYSPLFHMAPPTMVIPRAGSLALAAKPRFDAGETDDPMTLTPAYKRRSEAEVLWEKRHGGDSPCR